MKTALGNKKHKMMKKTLLTIIALFVSFLTLEAQDYSRYNIFHEEAVKLMAQGQLLEAKTKLEAIKKTCKGAIPPDNDLDALILKCIVISPSTRYLQFDSHDMEEQCVAVTNNMGQFKVSSNSNWCHVSKKKTKNYIYVVCDDNLLPKDRLATITLSSEGKIVTITVVQLGGDVKLIVQPDAVSFPKESHAEELFVYTNAESWSVDSVPNWIETQVGTDTLTIVASANKMAMPRETKIYIVAGQKRIPVSVFQAGSDTLVSASPNDLVFPNEESSLSFVVTSNLTEWQVSTSNEWIEAWKDHDSVRVMVHQNFMVYSRHGQVKVSAGNRFINVKIHQRPYVSVQPKLKSELNDTVNANADEIHVSSFPDGIKVTVYNDDHTVSSVNFTPFDMPVDYMHYTLQAGFEKKEAFLNDKQQDIVFEPGLRFATFTWSPKAAIGVMSGFVGHRSWGAYSHFQVNTPFVSDFSAGKRWLSGYNITFGPVFQPKNFPYVGAYAGIGLGGYVAEPHIGLDYEAGLMGFYKNIVISMGFHTSRVNSSINTTSFMLGVGGYLKRYYDDELGYCSSDSRRWTSVNYVFRPKEKGMGLMVGDIGSGKTRAYVKGMYLQPQTSDSLSVKNLEAGLGVLFTPVNGLIDLCVGASAAFNLSGLEERFQGVGLEVGTVVNVWRIPLTVFLHEVDLFGERYLCVDFGIGFHIGKFGKTNCTYQ